MVYTIRKHFPLLQEPVAIKCILVLDYNIEATELIQLVIQRSLL